MMTETLSYLKKYGIPIKRVLVMDQESDGNSELTEAETGLGWMVNSSLDGFDGLYGPDAKAAVQGA